MKRRLLCRLVSLIAVQRMACAVALALTLAAGAAHATWAPTFQANLIASQGMNNLMWRRVTHVNCWPIGHCQYIGTKPQARSTSGTPAQLRNAGILLSTGDALATTKGIEQLVASFPDQYKLQIGEVFVKLVGTFNTTVASTYGIPVNNLATAYAAVMAGGYAAYTNQPFPESAVKPLFEQAERAMLNDTKLLQVSMDDKTIQYQMWVGVGMFLLGWQNQLAQHPNPEQQAKMQKAGADALRALGFDPDRVRFTANGMQLD